MTWPMTCCAGTRPSWPPRAGSCPPRSCRNSDGTRLNAAQRAVDRKTNETKVTGPVIDGMDLRGVCLTVDALHSLVDLNKRVLARGGHVIFVIKGNQSRTYQALDAIAWEQIPVAAATFEAGRGRVETRTVQVSAAPAGLKYPGMQQAALI